jgi:Acetyltransferase (GNAT) domain
MIPGLRASRRVSIRWMAASDTPAAERIWTALEARLGGGGLACSWAWTGTWLDHYGDVVPHRFAVGEADGAACAIALVTQGVGQRRGPFPLRSVHLGTAGERRGESVYVEYNRILAAPEHRLDFAAALVAELGADPAWHELGLDGFAPEDAEPLLAAEPRLEARREICPIVDLRRADGSGGDVLATLAKGTRKKIRRSLRGLGDVEGEWAETADQALAILDELIGLHQARWVRAGQPGAFASPRFVAFHRALVRRLAPAGGVSLFRVRGPGGTVGCAYGFVERHRLLAYQAGLAPYADPQIRPGFVTDALCMQCARDRGLEEYDFLAPETMYKRQLSTGERELVWATWRRPALQWQLVDALAAVKRRVAARAGPRPHSGARARA